MNRWLRVILGLFLASLALRPQILAIGPLLPLIRADLGLPAAVGGLLTTIPVLCMGLFAPVGPRLAARIGTRWAFAACLVVIVGFGLARVAAPGVLPLLAATLGIGIGIGTAGAVPSMVVSQRIPGRPVLGTGAYAGGIVAGSTVAAALAVPLATDGDWRRSLAIISAASAASVVSWLVLMHGDRGVRPASVPLRHLPWRSATGWLLVLLFGLQSILFYGVVAWLPNAFVERGWSTRDAGALIAVFNGVGLITTIGIPLIADRLGARRRQLIAASILAIVPLVGVIVAPPLAFLWVGLAGLALGAVFPLVLTLPLDVADDPSQVGSVAALMLLGGYAISSTGPVLLGTARDITGRFDLSLWMLVGIAVLLVLTCIPLSAGRLRRGVRRDISLTM
jgi:CP family cyanate transporter-like MFS transporter